MRPISILALIIVFLILSVDVLPEVPHVINYQGRLTNSSDQPVNDATYTLQFFIYADSAISMIPHLWTETQDVSTKEGLFNVLLGTLNPIDPSIFEGSVRYLAIKVGSDPELTPRTPIVSVPYAMVAGTASGSVDCNDCDDIFINAIGPDELTATGDTALKITNTGPDAHLGLQVRLETSSVEPAAAVRGIINSTSADASCYGGVFDAISTGTGTTKGIQTIGENNSPAYPAFGIQGIGRNNGMGQAGGGWFEASSNGSGAHWGIYSSAFSASNAECAGVRAQAQQSGMGPSYGGCFFSYGGGGKTYGVYTRADGEADSTTYGFYSRATNDGDGYTIGGYFEADSTGSSSPLFGSIGVAYGDDQEVSGYWATVCNNSTSRWAYGSVANVYNTSGGAQGGAFNSIAGGSSAVGVYGTCQYLYGVTGTWAYGVYGLASNGEAAGGSYGGYFGNQMTGGSQYGIYAAALNSVNQPQYGLYAIAEDATGSSQSTFGVYGRCERDGSMNGYGGYFLCDSTGSGHSYGARTVASTDGSSTALGVASYAAAYGTGAAYGGFFEIPNVGTGSKYAVYGKSPSAGYAGYFDGDIGVSGDIILTGARSVALETSPGEYRLVYCQESPEYWFEDFGEGRLVNGRTHIDLDPMFLQTVTVDEENPMKVFVQLNDPECNGTAVIRGTTGFDVVELQNGEGSASFSYRVVAKRRGYEQLRLEQLPGMSPKEIVAQAESASNDIRIADESNEEEIARQKQLDVERKIDSEPNPGSDIKRIEAR